MENLAEKRDNNSLVINEKNIYEELRILKDQYTNLSKAVCELNNNEKSINSLKESIDSLFHEFNEVNKNVEDITSMLSQMSVSHNSNVENSNNALNLRGLTIKTLSSILSIIDTTMEKTSGLGEGLEDLIAEAQYENKRRRLGFKNSKTDKIGH